MNIQAILEKKLLEKFQQDGFTDCYLVEIFFNPTSNKVDVFVDSDSSLTLDKCRSISRYLESYLDEDLTLGEDYTLEVSSPGLDRPLKFLRQYKKNIGRFLEVTTQDGQRSEGRLKEVLEDTIILESRIKKEMIQKTIKHSDIAKVFVQIKF